MEGESAYRKLEVWQCGMDLVVEVYRLIEAMPSQEKFGLVSQIQRAAVSIPANIAEGYGRVHRGDYVRHLSIARGSLMELETHLTLCVRLNMLERDKVIPVWQITQKTGKKLTALIRSLKSD